jgi:hypothetical protein
MVASSPERTEPRSERRDLSSGSARSERARDAVIGRAVDLFTSSERRGAIARSISTGMLAFYPSMVHNPRRPRIPDRRPLDFPPVS